MSGFWSLLRDRELWACLLFSALLFALAITVAGLIAWLAGA